MDYDTCVHMTVDRGRGDYQDAYECGEGHGSDDAGYCDKCKANHCCPDGCPDRFTRDDAMSMRSEV